MDGYQLLAYHIPPGRIQSHSDNPQMAPILTTADLDTAWQTLQLSHPGLPSQLRDPQRDALFWLSQGKNVILCIGTGDDTISDKSYWNP